MGKLRINEINIIVDTIANKVNEKNNKKIEDFIQSYKPTKQEKQYLLLLEQINTLTEKKEKLRKQLQVSTSIVEGFMRDRAISKIKPTYVNKTILKNDIILRNIDPLFNVETFINDTVNNLTAE